MGLQRTVGLNDDGSFAANLALDQQQVADLLMRVPLPNGGLRTSSGPATVIPQPFVDGAISGELVGAIHVFQFVQSASLNIDLRVEPNGPTFLALGARVYLGINESRAERAVEGAVQLSLGNATLNSLNA